MSENVRDDGTNGGFVLSMLPPDRNQPVRLFSEAGASALSPQWSPDGQLIAFGLGAFFNNRNQPARLMTIRRDGSSAREIRTGAANSGFPSWSPDGRRPVFRAWSDTDRGLRIVTLADSSVSTLSSGYDNFPMWSPTGNVIVFTRFQDGDFDIFTVRPDGSDLTRLTTTPGNDAHAVWSPDGQYILFSSTRFGFKDELPLSEGGPQPAAEIFITSSDRAGS